MESPLEASGSVAAPRLTFLVPVYNAQPYLEACVESCVAFPWPDREVVLVDDGSTDGSGLLCDQLKERLEGEGCRCVVVHQPNGGVSRARNAGLARATGQWIWMVDADDRVLTAHPALPDADTLAHAERVVTGYVWEEAGRLEPFGASPADLPFNLWRCWFRRDLIERSGLRFTEGRRYAEDQEFIWRYTLAMAQPPSRHTEVIPTVAYHYTLRAGSAMTRPGTKWRQVRDTGAVLASFAWRVLASGRWSHRWVWTELRRMTKTFLVMLRK